MLKRIILILMAGFIIIEFTNSKAWAIVRGTPTVYRVTVRKIEISKDGGVTWVTLGSGDMTFNIASVNAGAVVGNYISNTNVEAGTYNKMRATVSRTFTVRGNILQDAGANAGNRLYTNPNGATLVAANEGEQSVTCPTTDLPSGISLSPSGDFYCTQDINLTFSASSPNTVTINFNVANVLELYPDDSFFPQPPGVTVTN